MQMISKREQTGYKNQKNRFTIKSFTRDKETHYIVVKESVHQQDITIINTYAPNIKV